MKIRMPKVLRKLKACPCSEEYQAKMARAKKSHVDSMRRLESIRQKPECPDGGVT